MADTHEQQIFIRALRIKISQDGFSFVHDYGEKYFTWDSISHVFGFLVEKKTTFNLPLCVFLSRNSQSLYCIDGNTIIAKDINGEKPQKKQYQSAIEARKTKEEDLKKIMGEICWKSTKTYIDKPLIKYLKGGKSLLLSLVNIREIVDYCRKVMDSITEDEFLGARVFKTEEEALKISQSQKEKEEWKEGSIIEGQVTIQQIFREPIGTTFLVFDQANVRFHMMKTFHERYIRYDQILKQFITEAENWIRLGRHPNIVQAGLIKKIASKFFILLEFVLGTNLEKLLHKGPITPVHATDWAIQFCSGMDYAFRKAGLIHCGIRPAKCLITSNRIIKITDFGLEKIFQEIPADGNLVAIPQESKDKSSSASVVIETLPYMAPELFSNLKNASIQSDIYASGILFYEMLTGKNPFSNANLQEIILKHFKLKPESPSNLNPEVPVALSNLVLKCIEKYPENRYSNFEEIKLELEKIYEELTGYRYIPPVEKEALSEEDWINIGKYLESIGRQNEAVISFEQAIHLNKTSIIAWIHRATSLIALGKIKEAYAILTQALNINPNDWRIYYNMGEVQLESGSLNKAITCLNTGLRKAAETLPLFERKIQLLYEAGKYEEALDTIDESLRTNPRNGELLLRRALAVLNLGYYDECKSLCYTIRKINPDHEESLLLFNSVTKKLEEKELIIESINSSAGFEKDFILKDLNTFLSVFCNINDALSYLETISEEPKINYLKACLYFAEGDREKCMQYLEKAIKPRSALNDDGSVDPEKYLQYLKESLKDTETKDAALKLKKFAEELHDAEKQVLEEKQRLPEHILLKKEQELSLKDKAKTPELMLLYGLERLRKNLGKEARDLFKQAITIDPNLTACVYFIGKTIEISGDMKNAIIAYNEFINNFPNSIGYWKETLATQNVTQTKDIEKVYHRLIGILPQFHLHWISYLIYLLKNNYHDKARLIASHLLDNFEEKLDIPKKKALFWNVKGLLQLFLLRYRKAIISFNEALKRDENNLTAHIGILQCYIFSNKIENAISHCDKIKTQDLQTGLFDYFSAELNMGLGLYKKSLICIEAGLKKNPVNLLLLMKKAQILLSMENYREFFNIHTRILSLDPNYLPIKMLYVIALVANQKIYDAVPELTSILSIDPLNLVAQKNLGIVYIYQNQPLKAIDAFESALTIYGNDYEIYMGMGIAQYMNNDYNLAYDSFLKAIGLNTTDPDLWQFLGAINYLLGNYTESEKCWNRALKYQSNSLQALINKGYFFYHMKKFNQAMEIANKAIRINEQNVSTCILITMCHWKNGRLNEALEGIDRVISLAPESIKAWTIRGILKFYHKNYESSYYSFEKASGLESKNANIWYNRAIAAIFLENYEDARKSLERCSSINRYQKALLNSRIAHKETKKPKKQFSLLELNPFDELIARYTIERESGTEIAAQNFYSQAQQVNPARFRVWAEQLAYKQNPRDLLYPQEILADPFDLTYNRPLVKLEFLSVFNYLYIKDFFN